MPDSKDFWIDSVRIWDGSTEVCPPLSRRLRVREGRIAAITGAGEGSPGDLPVVDLAGRTLIPGLIDAHVHLELDPALRTPAEQLAVPRSRREATRARHARQMLAAGITTARDCGGGEHGEHALRDRIDAGAARGPRLLCCGQPLTTPDGHCAFWGGGVSTRLEIDSVVERQVEMGSDWIKVMATGGVFTPGSRPRDAQFDLGRLRAIVETASRHGRSVAAHCHGTQGISNAVRAGVRTIEHASFAGPDGFGTRIDESLMRALAAADLWVSPTVHGGWGRRIVDEAGELTDFFRRMSRCLRLQRSHGVRFIASTDAGIPGVEHADLLDGLKAFARFADLEPVEVLRSATSEAARALGLEGETGRIAVGCSADFLVVEGDPLRDLEVLRDPELVVFRGRVLDRAQRARLAGDPDTGDPTADDPTAADPRLGTRSGTG
ncbi:MAG: metal-dependent hydrolase family protein [bacterium]